MASKRVKKKQLQRAQLQQINSMIEKAQPFIDSGDLKKLSKKTKTSEDRSETLKSLSSIQDYVEQQQAKIDFWRSQGMKIKWGKVKYHNTLENMDKYHLIKRYFELVKQGLIKHNNTLEYYEDVADYALEEMTDEQLQQAIADAEKKQAIVSFTNAKMVQF